MTTLTEHTQEELDNQFAAPFTATGAFTFERLRLIAAAGYARRAMITRICA